jgi:hypothetical protein
MMNVDEGKTATPRLAFRVARLAGVPIDDLLAGNFPPRGLRTLWKRQAG